jgi:uncharacterized membrane protein YkvA (DUF1232 family)
MSIKNRMRRKAQQIIDRQTQVLERLASVAGKTGRKHVTLLADIGTAFRMLVSWKRGEYRLSNRTLWLCVLALGYFLNPIDLIPDFIPVIGLLDDLAVLILLIHLLKSDLKEYKEWEDLYNSRSKSR